MKFTTETSKLKEALQRLGFAVNNATVLPATKCILVSLGKGKVTLTTTDLQVTILFEIEAETEGEEGMFLLPFAPLKNIVSVEDGPVTIEWKKKGATAKFHHDTFNLGNQGDRTDFPMTPTVSSKGLFELGNELLIALKTSAVSVGKDDNKPLLMNICMELNKESVVITSTDGHQLYTHLIPGTIPVEDKTELLLNPVVAKVLDGFESAKVAFNKNHVAFESGPISVLVRRGEGLYPDWRKLMLEHKANLTLDLHELQTGVEKAYIMSDTLQHNGIDFFIEPTQVELRTGVKDSGLACNCKISADAQTDVKQIRFNGRLLKRMIQQLETHVVGEGKVLFSLTDAKKQAIVKLEGKPEVTALLASINISEPNQ